MSESIFFTRHSGRSYLDREIPAEILDRLIEKTRWSPSCANKQPWRYVFVRETGQHSKFAAALAPGNEWAAKAPILIAVCAKEADDVTRNDDPVRYYQFDCGLGVMSLLLAAADEGLMGHAMAGYDAAAVHKALSIPAEYHVMCVVSLGYEGSLDLLDDKTRAKDESPRTRKEVGEIVAFDSFTFK